jgi:hypothetical protein
VARLLKDASPHYRVLPGMAWSKALGVEGSRRAPRGAQRTAMVTGQPVGWCSWAMAHLLDMVEGTHSLRGGRATVMQSSLVRSTVPELNGGEGWGPVAQKRALSSGCALGPAHR